jgi:protein SCO1
MKIRPPAPRAAVPVAILLAALLILLFAARPAAAHTARDPQDAVLEAIGVDEKRGASIPLDLPFTDQAGRAVTLRDSFGDGPVLLTLNYYSCPMLCPLTLVNLLETTQEMKGISLERDYRIVTVSIDPEETLESTRATAAQTHAMLGEISRPAERWTFLFGGERETKAAADAVGFRYEKVGAEFAHPNVLVILTPEGKVSRYLYGVKPDARDLRLALIEAAEGRIGASAVINRMILSCFQYDPVGKRYVLYAANIMKAAGALTVVLLGSLLFTLRKRERTRAARR